MSPHTRGILEELLRSELAALARSRERVRRDPGATWPPTPAGELAASPPATDPDQEATVIARRMNSQKM